MELLQKQPKESAKQYVKRTLLYNIVNTYLPPGAKILEKDLCDAFQLSRTPIREAILELQKDHLIDIRPKQGTYISLIDEQRVEEVRSLREVLESELAVLACAHHTPDDIDRLRENVIVWKYYIEKGEERKIFEFDKKFHALLYALCRRGYWYEIVTAVAPHFDRTTVLSFRCQPTTHVLTDHEQLVDAIEANDTATAYAIARHHMHRYHENIAAIKAAFPTYFAAP